MKRAISLLLALIMCLSIITTPAMAINPDDLYKSIQDMIDSGGEDIDFDFDFGFDFDFDMDTDMDIDMDAIVEKALKQAEEIEKILSGAEQGGNDGASSGTTSGAILEAAPTASTVLVNGQNVAFDAYLINGNNYFKLRDLAYTLNGTQKQFSVGWDGSNNAITLTSGQPYTAIGGEMTGKGAGIKTPEPTT